MAFVTLTTKYLLRNNMRSIMRNILYAESNLYSMYGYTRMQIYSKMLVRLCTAEGKIGLRLTNFKMSSLGHNLLIGLFTLNMQVFFTDGSCC